MGFEALLGNTQLKENLKGSLSRGHVSHFYLISGPEGAGKKTLAKLLAAAILCKGSNPPCGSCTACRKVLGGSHPDVITVDDPEKKTVTVQMVREAREDMFIRPNEADYKIYTIPRAQDMRMEAQNALLKVLEEPPKYGVFMLLTDNPDKMLPTIRSRCTELTLQPLGRETLLPYLQGRYPQAQAEDLEAAIQRSGGFLGQALTLLEQGEENQEQLDAFLKAFGENNPLELTRLLVPLERWNRDALGQLLRRWRELLEEAMICQSGIRTLSPMSRKLAGARSSQELYRAAEVLKKSETCLLSNVSPAAVCGYLVWALRK